MKNKFKFLATMLIGILLSTNVWGALTGTYTKVTDISTLANGNKVILAMGSTEPTTGVTGGTADTGSKTKHDAEVSGTESNWMKFTVEVVTGGVRLKCTQNSTDYYIGNPTDNTFYLILTSSSSNIGVCTVANDGKLMCNSRYLCQSSSYYRMYESLTSKTPFYVWKVESSKPLSSIAVKTAPTTVVYTEGQYFDPTGLVITKTYDDTSTEDLAYAGHESDFTFSPTTSAALTIGTTSVTITVGGKSTTQSITVNARVAATITLMEAGTPVAGPSGKYSGETYTLPSSVTNVCDGKTFVGWSTVDIPMPGDKPIENYYGKGAEVTLAATNTFYAVYADAAGGADPVAYTAGDEGSFVLAALNDGKWYALPTNPTVSSGKITGVEISVSQTGGGVNYVTTENATGFTWTIANATNGQTISDGTKYIYHSNGGSSGTSLEYGNKTEFTWTIESETNGLTFQGTNGATVNGRGMLVSGTNFGGYSLSNEDQTGYYRISVLPISGASYSNYTTCGSKYSVTFKNQESVISTTEYTAGTVIHAPATAENTCGEGFFFVGWLAQPLYVGDTPNPKPSGLIQPNGEITVPAEDVVYYAVFATKVIN